jgi:hypothetical protein
MGCLAVLSSGGQATKEEEVNRFPHSHELGCEAPESASENFMSDEFFAQLDLAGPFRDGREGIRASNCRAHFRPIHNSEFPISIDYPADMVQLSMK